MNYVRFGLHSITAVFSARMALTRVAMQLNEEIKRNRM